MLTARRIGHGLVALFVAAGAGLLGADGWLCAKAAVARVLIDRAFEAHLADGAVHRPWDWADTYPVARIDVPRLGVRRTVLAGASGASLAFGPGHVDGTARPNTRGDTVVAGHRDTWFAFLDALRTGDRIDVTTRERVVTYRVVRTRVVPAHETDLDAPAEGRRLHLVTCWPFGGLTSSPWRYIVTCEPEPVVRSGPLRG